MKCIARLCDSGVTVVVSSAGTPIFPGTKRKGEHMVAESF